MEQCRNPDDFERIRRMTKKNWQTIKRVLKENRFPVSVIDEQNRVVRYRTEEAALVALGPVKIINHHPDYFWMPRKS
jgi:ATP:corrinoid adenosyltransferase